MNPSTESSVTNALSTAHGQPTEFREIKLSSKRAPLIRRSDSEWLRIFKDLEERGETLANYCTPRRMSPSSFSAKRKTLLERYKIKNILTADLDSIEKSERQFKESHVKPMTSQPAHTVEMATEDIVKAELTIPYGHTNNQTSWTTKPASAFTMTFGDASFEFSTEIDPKWLANFIKEMNA